MSGGEAEVGAKGGNKMVGTGGFLFGGDVDGGMGGVIDGGGEEETYRTDTDD